MQVDIPFFPSAFFPHLSGSVFYIRMFPTFQRIYDIVCVAFLCRTGCFLANGFVVLIRTGLHRRLFRLYLFIAMSKWGEYPTRNLLFSDDVRFPTQRTNTISITQANELKKNISENRFNRRFRCGGGGPAFSGNQSGAGRGETPRRPFPSRCSGV